MGKMAGNDPEILAHDKFFKGFFVALAGRLITRIVIMLGLDKNSRIFEFNHSQVTSEQIARDFFIEWN